MAMQRTGFGMPLVTNHPARRFCRSWLPPVSLHREALLHRVLHRVLRRLLLPALLLSPMSFSSAQDPSTQQQAEDQLTARMQARIAQLRGAEVAVVVQDLGSPRRVEINGDTVFHAASTMKVPVLIDLMREFDAGRLQRAQSMLLVNTYHSIVDGTPYSLQSADDSDSLVFQRVGDFVPLTWLAERMITHSSNLATNALIAILDPSRITATMRTFGAKDIQVLRGVEDNVAYQAGRNNVTTANDLAAILTALERGETASQTSTEFMRATLLQQAFNEQIPAGLPPGTSVAHKTGSITATLHDAAIVYPPDRSPFVMVVLTRGIPESRAAEALTADLATLAWQWLVLSPATGR